MQPRENKSRIVRSGTQWHSWIRTVLVEEGDSIHLTDALIKELKKYLATEKKKYYKKKKNYGNSIQK
jgi:hypothetical protein